MNRLGFLLALCTITLALLSVFILFETSTYGAFIHLNDRYYYIKNQLVWVFLGIVTAFIVSLINYKRLYYLSLPLLFVSLLVLLLVFIPGIGLSLKGASRWVDFKLFVVQPSELLKITLSLYLAAWLSSYEKKRLLAFLLLFGLCISFVALQPDLGTSFIIAASSIVVYFLSGAKFREMFFIFLILCAGVIALVYNASYRTARFTSFVNFDAKDILKSDYHLRQIVLALGSSGVSGVGIGNSISKYGYLPEATTDSIFTIYAEETGFLGSIALVMLFIIEIFLGYLIALKVKDRFGKLLASGITTFIGIQAFINISSQAVLIPLTGVPLPFVSYGGSSMLINFLAIGILLSISRKIN